MVVHVDEITKDAKVTIFKKRKRKNSRRRQGFRRDVGIQRCGSFPHDASRRLRCSESWISSRTYSSSSIFRQPLHRNTTHRSRRKARRRSRTIFSPRASRRARGQSPAPERVILDKGKATLRPRGRRASQRAPRVSSVSGGRAPRRMARGKGAGACRAARCRTIRR